MSWQIEDARGQEAEEETARDVPGEEKEEEDGSRGTTKGAKAEAKAKDYEGNFQSASSL